MITECARLTPHGPHTEFRPVDTPTGPEMVAFQCPGVRDGATVQAAEATAKLCGVADSHEPHFWEANHWCPGVDAKRPPCTKAIGEHFEDECGLPSVGLVGGKPRCMRHWEPTTRWDQIDEIEQARTEIERLRGLVDQNARVHQQEMGRMQSELNRRDSLAQVLQEQIASTGGHPADREAVIHEVCQWWAEVAAKDVLRFAPKAVEYGAGDLSLMGDGLRMLSGTDKWEGAGDAGEREQVGQELAIIFYLHGKIGRCISAYAEGRLPSDDTLEDLRIYSMMLTRVRQFGRLL